jgi:HTH-type transcriptional regulator/antitoxin HigA
MSVAERSDSWSPDWAVHPGAHLAEYLESRGWSQAEFARLAGLSPKLVSTIIGGTNPVTAETALKLEHVLGMKANVWTGLQADWDLHEARQASQRNVEECQTFLRRFPVKELSSRGVLPTGVSVEAMCDSLLSFLGIGAPSAFDAKLRSLAVQHRQSRSFVSDDGHVVAWLMLGERRARAMQLRSFDEARFIQAVAEVRGLTCEPPEVFAPRMIDLCAASGVAVIFEPPLPRTRLFGSARWMEGSRAIIQMSLRMKSNDHFWWTFFHEAGHVMLHRGRTFADDLGGEGNGAEEEADMWAEEQLVGRDRFDQFCQTAPRSESAVRTFASEVGVHPGVIVGMLQHRHILPFTHLNGLKARFEWVSPAKA